MSKGLVTINGQTLPNLKRFLDDLRRRHYINLFDDFDFSEANMTIDAGSYDPTYSLENDSPVFTCVISGVIKGIRDNDGDDAYWVKGDLRFKLEQEINENFAVWDVLPWDKDINFINPQQIWHRHDKERYEYSKKEEYNLRIFYSLY